MSNQYNTSVTTGKVRFSYVNLFEPVPQGLGGTGEKKFSMTILIPKTDADTVARINAAIQEAVKKGLDGIWDGVQAPNTRMPLHDGDGVKEDGKPFGEECKGHWVMTARAKADYPPEVVDAQGNAVLRASDVYSGCYGRVYVTFYPYGGGQSGYNKGIGVGLGPVQKLEDGEPLGGAAPKASDVFGFAAPASEAAINPITGLPM